MRCATKRCRLQAASDAVNIPQIEIRLTPGWGRHNCVQDLERRVDHPLFHAGEDGPGNAGRPGEQNPSQRAATSSWRISANRLSAASH